MKRTGGKEKNEFCVLFLSRKRFLRYLLRKETYLDELQHYDTVKRIPHTVNKKAMEIMCFAVHMRQCYNNKIYHPVTKFHSF